MLQEMIMDILRAIASPNIDIKRKTLDLVLDLILQRQHRQRHGHVEDGSRQVAE